MIKISIITPAFNNEKTIEQTTESVINQSYREFEHIIIDNCSTDNTVNIVKKLYASENEKAKLKVVSEPDSGISDAFNKGIKISGGDVVGILNADDHYYDSSVLQKVADAFKNIEILFAHGNIFFEDRKYGSNIRRPLMCPITHALPFNHPAMFFKKEVYEKYGLYNVDYKQAMDFEFICRLEKNIPGFRSKGGYINGDPLVYMRAGGSSWQNELNSLEEVKRALMKYDLWNKDAERSYYARVFRTRAKKYFDQFSLGFVIKLWRKNKWQKKSP